MTSISKLTADHSAFEETRNQSDPSWLRELRTKAIQQSESLGLPTTRQEEWRYTDVSRLAKETYEHKTSEQTSPQARALPFALAATLHFVNGRFVSSENTGLPDGVIVANLREAIGNDSAPIEKHLGQIADPGFHGLTALNTAYLGEAAVVFVPLEVKVSHPIRVVFENTDCADRASYPRLILIADKNSSVTLIEEHIGTDDSAYLSNTVAEFAVGDGALVKHFIWNQSGRHAVHISTTEARVSKDGSFQSHNLCLGGELVRNDLNIRFDGPGGETNMDCLYITSDIQHVDNHTRVDHLHPHCTSAERYKGILGGRSHGVFNGKVVVHKDAQKTNAEQSNHNILLSPQAAIDSKPELEIYADDVRCSHGSTVGQLDDQALFFMRTRGIPKIEAQKLLTHAFANSILQTIEHEGIAAYARNLVKEKLDIMAKS